MFCTNCGNKINPGEGFCTKCGTAAGAVAAPQQVSYANPALRPEDDKKANLMCIISLILKYGVGLIAGIVYGVAGGLISATGSSSPNSSSIGVLNTALSILASISGLAAFILMIVVRVKFPRNTFGKVIMWIYVIEIIVGVIGFALILASCVYILRSCG